MDFQISLVGLNHRTAGVDVRERFALTDHSLPETWALPASGSLRESLILSTCNRVELLAVGDSELKNELLAHWARARNATPDELLPYIYFHSNLDAARHVFEVASSLDSMILGEPQILGQLKDAYRKSVNSGNAGSILNKLMHTAFFVAKRVRNETAVAASAVSISYAAVELAKRIFEAMPGHTAMLVGAGEMAELAAMHLLQAGIDKIFVLNRTLERGQALASKFGGEALPFGQLENCLKNVDIIITSTGSKEPIITISHMRSVLKSRKNRPVFIIDIAVPRDVDPEVNTLDNIYLYDIDDLREVVEENMAARKEEAEKAHIIIEEEIRKLAAWLDNLALRPTIISLLQRGEKAAREELARTLRHMPHLTPSDKSRLEVMALAIARKLNHEPLMFLKNDAPEYPAQPERIKTIRNVFDLDNLRGHARKQ